MNKIIHEVYFDKIRYVLANLKQLDVSNEEILFVLIIIMLHEQNKVVSVEEIIKVSNFSAKEIDRLITILAGKNFLEIKVSNGMVDFNIDKIFDMESEVNLDVSDLFKVFQDEFSRMLTQQELRRLNEWVLKYSREDIILALRNASIMNKLHFNYINRILENNDNE